MAIRSNRFFNNDGFRAAAQNLTALFAPPSGSDVYAWTRAGGERDKNQRLQQFYDYMANAGADYDRGMADRLGIGAGVFNPNQSFYSVDQGNLTTRRGQDIQSADRRYDTDVGARTTLQTNRLDNQQRALTDLYGPLNPGQVRPEVPDELSSIIFGPEVGPIGETRGVPKPMSETELDAATKQRLMDEGLLTDDMLLDTIMGERSPVEAVGPSGSPVFMSPGAAVRQGAEPFVEPKSPGTIRMYRTPDGRIGRTVDGLTDMSTGAEVPPDAVVGTIGDTSESFGDTELSKTRTDLLNRQAGLRSMIDQVVAVDQMLAGANADQTVGVVGSAASLLNDVATQAGAILRATGIDAPQGLRDVTQYQDTFRALGIDAQNIKSALLDLAYATASSRESGKLTENDVDRALRTIGANLQDPMAMRQVLRGAVERATTDYRAREKTMMGNYGDSLNIEAATLPEIPPIRPDQAPQDTRPTGGAEQWERGPDGTLRRVQ